jgi:polyisoprenoid-binding protein YceI
MRKYVPCAALVVAVLVTVTSPARGEDYAMDSVHSSVSFKIQHLGISWIHGRFKEMSGSFTIDKDDAGKSAFELTIQAESVDTNNEKRDTHLRSGDFFNVKQFPTITFKSTAVKPVEGGYEVTGDLSMHGETKPITFTLKGGKEAEFPKGVKRTGYSTDLNLKRSNFGMTKFPEPMLGDEVQITVSFEGTKK